MTQREVSQHDEEFCGEDGRYLTLIRTQTTDPNWRRLLNFLLYFLCSLDLHLCCHLYHLSPDLQIWCRRRWRRRLQLLRLGWENWRGRRCPTDCWLAEASTNQG